MTNHLRSTTMAFLFCLAAAGAVPAAAQGLITDVASGASDQTWAGTSANSLAGWILDQGDVGVGDARNDLIVGAPGASANPGHVYVIFGGPVQTGSNALTDADVVLNGSGTDRFGQATAAGNILSTAASPRDLLVGAPSADSNKGRVYVFAAPLDRGVLGTADARATIVGRPGDRIGTALGTADVNGDGYRDLIIGAGGSQRVYVVYGGASLSGTIDLSVTAPGVTMTGTSIGNVIAAGDVTGDGRYDLLIGAELAANNAGRVYLVTGRTGALPATMNLDTDANAVFTGRNAGDNAGTSVHVGDFDADGIKDILIGAPGSDGITGQCPNCGAAYVLWGRATFTSMSLASADVTIDGAAANDYAGTELNAGDINRDTPNDILILSAGARSGNGAVYALYGRSRHKFGSSISLASTFDRMLYNSAPEGRIGNASAFEVTGEGANDIILSHPFATTAGGASAGKVYVSLSPKLRPTPRTIALSVAAGQRVTATVAVENPGVGTLPWSASTSTSWLTLSPATGTSDAASSGSFVLTADASNLSTGTITGTVKVTSLTKDLDMFLDVTVTLTVKVPVSRISDVDGDGKADGTPPTPKFVIGLGPMKGNGGWFEVHAGTDRKYGLAAWVRQPWMTYNRASGEVYVALGDVDGDGLDEVVLGFGAAMHGWLLVLDDDAHDYAVLKWIHLDWASYDGAYGVTYPAVGDIDGDGKAEIVAGVGDGGAGWFEIFDDASNGFAPLGWRRVQWDLYNGSGSGATHPAIGDLDGDGKAEIVIGLGHGGAGWAEVFSSSASNYQPRAWMRSSDTAYNAGAGIIWPAAGDIDGDGRAEVVLGLGAGGHGKAEVRDDANAGFASLRWIQSNWSTYNDEVGEVHPAVGNLDADGPAEIILGLGPYPNGGWYLLFDDGTTGNAIIGWRQVVWAPYNASGGPTWPAIGKLR